MTFPELHDYLQGVLGVIFTDISKLSLQTLLKIS